MKHPTGRWTFGKPFRYDADLEALLALRETDRARWEALKPAIKVKLAFYEGCKASYEDGVQEQLHAQALEAAVERDDWTDPFGDETPVLEAVPR